MPEEPEGAVTGTRFVGPASVVDNILACDTTGLITVLPVIFGFLDELRSVLVESLQVAGVAVTGSDGVVLAISSEDKSLAEFDIVLMSTLPADFSVTGALLVTHDTALGNLADGGVTILFSVLNVKADGLLTTVVVVELLLLVVDLSVDSSDIVFIAVSVLLAEGAVINILLVGAVVVAVNLLVEAVAVAAV